MREVRTVDSVFVLDSVIVKTAGDTVWVTRWRDRWRERIVHDTLAIHTTDTVVVTRTVTVSDDGPERVRIPGWAVAILFATIVMAVLITIRRFLNHN